MRNIFIISIMVLITSCGLFYDEQKIMREAESAQKAGNFSAAIIGYKKVLQHNAENKKARIYLAQSYIATGQGAVAEKELKHAISLGVPRGQLLAMLARSILLQHDYNRFLKEIRLQASISEKQYHEIQLLEAKAFLGKGDLNKARKSFETILEADNKNIDALASLGYIDQKSGQYASAEEKYDKALAINSKRYDVMLQKASLLQEENHKIKAIKIYLTVLGASVETKRADLEFKSRTQLANLFLQTDKFDKAKQQIDILTKKAKNHPYVWYLLGAYNYQTKNFDDARIDFEKVLAIAPNNQPALLFIGATQYATKNYEQANEYLTRFVNAQPTHIQARKLLGLTRLHLERPEKAFDVFKSGIDNYKADANDAEMLRLAGKAALQSRNNSVAIDYFKKSIQKSPNNTLIRKELAQAYLQEGDFDKAIDTLSKITGKDEVGAKYFIIQSYLKKGDYKNASVVKRKLLAEHPRDEEAYYIAAIAENTMGNRSLAYQHLEYAEKLHKNYLPALLALARLHIEDGEYNRASDIYNKILAFDSKNIQAMIGFAQLEEQKGNTQNVVTWLNHACEADKNALLPRLLLASYYRKNGDIARALKYANEAVAINDGSGQAHLLLAKLQEESGDDSSAKKTYEKIISKHPKYIPAYLNYVSLSIRQKKYTKAREILSNLLERSPGNLNAKIQLANLEIITNHPDKALEIARELKSHNKTRHIGESLAGDIYIHEKQYDNAINEYSSVYKSLQNATTAVALAVAYDKAGERKKGIDILEKFRSSNKGSEKVLMTLGSMYQQNKQNIRAVTIYEVLLQKDPNNPSVLNNMALAMLKSNPDKALSYAEKAYKMSHSHPLIKDTLGWIHYNRGEYTKAQELLASASAALNLPDVDYHYAAALVKAGEIDKATKILTKVLVTHDVFEDRKAAQALLRQIK